MYAKPNPLVTAEQDAMELRAVRLLARPDIRAACEVLKEYWLGKVRPNAEQRALFDWEFDQTAFCGVLNALNQDGDHPKLHAFGRFAHAVSGVHAPGTKHGHPNPDYIYWFAPVNGHSRYVISGHTGNAPPAAAEISLLDGKQVYLGNLSLHQIAIDADGGFTITVDPDPAGDRPNHLRSSPGAHQVLIRNVLSDLDGQLPMSLAIERLGATPVEEPDDDEIAPLCGPHIKKLIDDLMFVNANIVMPHPVNVFENPAFHDGGVYSVSQAYAPGHFRLADDEALVFTLTLGDAAYAVVPVTNIWGGIGHYLEFVGSLGTGRAIAGADGSYCVVVSLKDPGIYNWVDTGGLHEGVIFVRWVGFDPKLKTGAKPTLTCRLVELAELENALPPDIKRVTAAERLAQLERHASDYRRVTG
jgi:hypothetical protein